MIDRETLASLMAFDADTGLFSWRATGTGRESRVGSLAPNGYRQITVRGRKYQAHRLAVLYATGSLPVGDVDHINGNRDDNRLCNLRCVSRSLNMQNQHVLQKRNTSGQRGVSWHKQAGKWAARISGRHLGLFVSLEAAITARKAAETAYFTSPKSGFA